MSELSDAEIDRILKEHLGGDKKDEIKEEIKAAKKKQREEEEEAARVAEAKRGALNPNRRSQMPD